MVGSLHFACTWRMRMRMRIQQHLSNNNPNPSSLAGAAAACFLGMKDQRRSTYGRERCAGPVSLRHPLVGTKLCQRSPSCALAIERVETQWHLRWYRTTSKMKLLAHEGKPLCRNESNNEVPVPTPLHLGQHCSHTIAPQPSTE